MPFSLPINQQPTKYVGGGNYGYLWIDLVGVNVVPGKSVPAAPVGQCDAGKATGNSGDNKRLVLIARYDVTRRTQNGVDQPALIVFMVWHDGVPLPTKDNYDTIVVKPGGNAGAGNNSTNGTTYGEQFMLYNIDDAVLFGNGIQVPGFNTGFFYDEGLSHSAINVWNERFGTPSQFSDGSAAMGGYVDLSGTIHHNVFAYSPGFLTTVTIAGPSPSSSAEGETTFLLQVPLDDQKYSTTVTMALTDPTNPQSQATINAGGYVDKSKPSGPIQGAPGAGSYDNNVGHQSAMSYTVTAQSYDNPNKNADKKKLIRVDIIGGKDIPQGAV